MARSVAGNSSYIYLSVASQVSWLVVFPLAILLLPVTGYGWDVGRLVGISDKYCNGPMLFQYGTWRFTPWTKLEVPDNIIFMSRRLHVHFCSTNTSPLQHCWLEHIIFNYCKIINLRVLCFVYHSFFST